MRKQYGWYLKRSSAEITAAWNEGTLTVDANVLLDLYRYNERTRKDILAAIEQFKGRVWLSYQASEEFIRNRNKVIASAESQFGDTEKALNQFSSNVETLIGTLRAQRLIPADISGALKDQLTAAVEAAKIKVTETQVSHPNYFDSDPILDTIMKTFDGSVGDCPSDGETQSLIAEGKSRYENACPPGYLDAGKEESERFGDFFVWRQILEFAKASNKPVIFVTSERKEDWWEVFHGKRTGPRRELIKEASTFTDKAVLIYQTEQFLKLWGEHGGKRVNPESLQEISALADRRPLRRRLGVAVLASQKVFESDDSLNIGTIDVELIRPVANFTTSGQLDPRMIRHPYVEARLISAPDGVPETTCNGATGTNFDFNIHVKSISRSEPLPIGIYKIEYTAYCADEPGSLNDD